MSFLDASQGFYQIPMALEDQRKTAFVTEGGVYHFLVMPFGLKNAGATYQRLVNRMFCNELGKTMEAYVDDMLVKSIKSNDHIDDLSRCFDILRVYGMKLNPMKCTFGVRGGKFLGFMVNERGIEANPDKIKAILEMPQPRSVNDVQKLVGKLIALNRFISRSAERNLPFFKLFRKGATSDKAFEWTPECHQAFEDIKKYLTTPPC
jgi:hypothetical protein